MGCGCKSNTSTSNGRTNTSRLNADFIKKITNDYQNKNNNTSK